MGSTENHLQLVKTAKLISSGRTAVTRSKFRFCFTIGLEDTKAKWRLVICVAVSVNNNKNVPGINYNAYFPLYTSVFINNYTFLYIISIGSGSNYVKLVMPNLIVTRRRHVCNC
jgi:hypothetical protein